MADAKKGGAAQQVLAKHGEKIALGVSALLLLSYVFIFYLPDKKQPEADTLRSTMRKVEGELRKPKEDDAPKPPKAWDQSAVTPWNTVIAASAKGADDFAATLVTEIVASTKTPVKTRPPQAVAPSIAFENLEINLDSVVLSWSVKEFTAKEKAAMAKETPKHIPVDLTAFKIERDTNGSGKWEVLATLEDPKARTYKDLKIDAKTKYAYRVTAYSMKKEYLDNGGEESAPKPDGLVGTVASPPAQTLGIWKITFANASKAPNAEKGMAYVTIEKYEKALGAKVEKKRIHYSGDKIGWWAETSDGEPTSKHKVQIGSKAHEVDFNTEIMLVSVSPKKVTVEITKCRRKFGPGGLPEYPCDKVKEKRTFDIHEIVLNGPEGRQVIQSPNPKDHPNGQDQICEECGGKKPVDPKTLDPKTPEMPKEDPAAVAKKKKETEAETLFNDAEKLLKAGKKSEAAGKYERLLKEYAATDFVAKGQRPLIEQKLAETREK